MALVLAKQIGTEQDKLFFQKSEKVKNLDSRKKD